MKKLMIVASLFTLLVAQGCGPNVKSQADQATKTDSLDLQQGKGEGPVPEEVIK